ncbi:transporter [Ganoderma sinense ZZ0214-1]|uniref:Transporter n=1 Tax=Ganoderma sinense ZZ0214-1 TaxID=1077348 RepID=A0A2G8SN39_9APHY|nr:transporter [Ganoderma sinense ZZ0214-1]
MALSYFPASASANVGSPQIVAESSPKHLNEGVQEAYIEHKDRLLKALDSTKSILGELRKFNKDDWVVRYPQLQEQPAAAESSISPKRKGARRSLSFPDDPSFQADVIVSPAKAGLTRSVTLASIADKDEEPAPDAEDDTDGLVSAAEASDFHVFRLDLKLGPHGSSSSPAALVAQLEKSSIANLLDDRVVSAVNHLDKLRSRIEDTSSKVLVTGDLNAGKSTFVNALLRREIMPVDQQPCTTAFCEVHDATENDGKEEVHILKDGATYSTKDETTFTRASLSDLDAIVSENENESQVLRVYLADPRDPQASLLSNGIVDISLIDAPGLNRDNTHTTRVFARQEEIDVVVFVVSAENHFTLSAKEFLTNASKEKAYLFIVVNKYEQIRDKAKCRRLVLEQIKQLSPRTYEDAEDLVHFVDSQQALHENTTPFGNLESALRSFVLVKRSKSKLAPASTYLTKLLSDVDLLVGANAIVAQSELERARDDINRVRPVLEKMKGSREALEESLEFVEEDGASRSLTRGKDILNDAVERVGQGQPGVGAVSLPVYPGLFGIWEYASEVRRALLASLDSAVKLTEDEARLITTEAVGRIAALGDKHLPDGVERSRRVFMPEAMFACRKDKKGNRRSRQPTVVAGGLYGLGLGLAQRPDMLDTSFFDLFDVQHQFWLHFGDGKNELHAEEVTVSTLGVVSVGIGALTMVGGKVVGARSLLEGVVRVWDLLENETARKWAAPVLGAVSIGLVGYYVLELPTTIPRTVGRRIKTSLAKEGEEKGEESSFVGAHAARVSRETRKVLRLAAWDVKERFRSAMDERGREVHGAEDKERGAVKALDYFHRVEQRTGEVRESVVLVSAA